MTILSASLIKEAIVCMCNENNENLMVHWQNLCKEISERKIFFILGPKENMCEPEYEEIITVPASSIPATSVLLSLDKGKAHIFVIHFKKYSIYEKCKFDPSVKMYHSPRPHHPFFMELIACDTIEPCIKILYFLVIQMRFFNLDPVQFS